MVSDAKYVVDFDDLCDKHDPFNKIMELKDRLPGLKVTLFAIPGLCSDELLKKYGRFDWIELAVHGYYHSTRECAIWTYEDTLDRLQEIGEWWPGAKVFKAPGWVANEEVYRALGDAGYVIADNVQQHENWGDTLDLPRYVYNCSTKFKSIHGHTWDVCGNGPNDWPEMFKDVSHETEFGFVSEASGNATKNDIVQETTTSWSHKSKWGVRAAERLQEFMATIDPQAPVADFGGNDGFAAQASGLGRVEVVDGSHTRAAHARSQYGLKAHVEDFASMPFADGHFTWGFCSHTLEHLPNLDECWAEMKRVCREGIWVVVPVESQEAFDKNPAHLVRHTHEEWLERLGAKEIARLDGELICQWNP